jgi:regulator of replication initiation timing
METSAYSHDAQKYMSSDFNRMEILETVASLRDDVCSMSTNIREVLSENLKLKEEVNRLKARQDTHKGRTAKSEAQRLKDELNQLVQMHDACSTGRNKRQQIARPTMPPKTDDFQSSSMMKKMMMMMMMNELV